LIAKEDASAHLFEKVKCVSKNIMGRTVHNLMVLLLEVRWFIKFLAAFDSRRNHSTKFCNIRINMAP